jgi:hypothetical protein
MSKRVRIELPLEAVSEQRVKLFREHKRIRGSDLVRKEGHEFVLGRSGFEDLPAEPPKVMTLLRS